MESTGIRGGVSGPRPSLIFTLGSQRHGTTWSKRWSRSSRFLDYVPTTGKLTMFLDTHYVLEIRLIFCKMRIWMLAATMKRQVAWRNGLDQPQKHTDERRRGLMEKKPGTWSRQKHLKVCRLHVHFMRLLMKIKPPSNWTRASQMFSHCSHWWNLSISHSLKYICSVGPSTILFDSNILHVVRRQLTT
jgi:hypothetical protein